jgi:hypothetical protein
VAEKLPAPRGESAFVAAMEVELTCEGAILFELGTAVAEGVVHLIAAPPREVDSVGAGVAVDLALDEELSC